MDFEFSLPVKFYHTYFDYIHAPQGLNTSSRSLEKNKWKCFGPEAQARFCLRRERSYIVIQVTSNGRALDYTIVNTNEEPKLIQFFARNPSISCKYMVSPTHMRRFQVAFKDDADFLEANNKISNSGFVIVRAQVPNANLQPASVPQCSSQTPLQSMLSLLNQQKTTNDDVLLQSQLVSDMSTNVWERANGLTYNNPISKEPRERNSSLVQLTDPLERDKEISKERRINFTQFGDPLGASTMIPPNTLSSKPELDIIASQTYNSLTDTNKGLPESQFSPFSERNEILSVAPKPQVPSFAPLKTIPAYFTQAQMPETPESAPQYSLTPSQDRLTTLKSNHAHPLASAAIPPPSQKQKEQENKILKNVERKDLEVNAQSEVKISKRIIKRKLKDKKFLKWVSKVENVLKEMSEQRD